MSSYTASIPNTGDSLGSTRVEIHDNFAQIYTVQGVNHVQYNSIGAGKHKFLQMPEQTGTPPITLIDEIGVYAAQGTFPNEANLFVEGENSGFVYQMTRLDQALSSLFGTATQMPGYSAASKYGWTFLPGGLILNYGNIANADAALTNIVYAKPFQAAAFSITGQALRQITVSTGAGFTTAISGVLPASNSYFMAIGF